MRKNLLRLLFGAVLAVLLAAPACVDPNDGGSGPTSGTALYVFDGSDAPSQGRVLAWNDVSTLYETPSAAPNRVINGLALDSVKTLGLGGMCMDTAGNRLYLVAENGTVTRIESVRTKSGTLSSTTDIVSFTLGGGSGDRLTGSKFGQATYDPQTGTLYVTENGETDARIWVVARPEQYGQNANTATQTVTPTGDKKGYGVAVRLGVLYGTWQEGNVVIGSDATQYTGPRLRRGTATGFAANANVLVGTSNTQLRRYGALAYDANNDYIFVACHLTDSSTSAAPLLVFKTSQFSQGLDQAPEKTFGTSDLNNLRILAHGGTKDWLAAATTSGEQPSSVLYLWRNPLTAATPRTVTLGTARIRGLAFDGSA